MLPSHSPTYLFNFTTTTTNTTTHHPSSDTQSINLLSFPYSHLICPLTSIVLCVLSLLSPLLNLSPHHHLLSPFFSSQQQQLISSMMIIISLIMSMAEPISPPPHHQPPPQETAATTPELNLAVIIAALLCALLCALGLNSMLQCVFQCTHRTLTEPFEWVASRKLNSGLKKKDIVALPTLTYANDNNSPSPPSSSSSVSIGCCCCAICLVDFSDGDNIRVLPQCDHRFHVACIDEWLLSHSFCPTCRRCLKSKNCAPCLEIVTAF